MYVDNKRLICAHTVVLINVKTNSLNTSITFFLLQKQLKNKVCYALLYNLYMYSTTTIIFLAIKY